MFQVLDPSVFPKKLLVRLISIVEIKFPTYYSFDLIHQNLNRKPYFCRGEIDILVADFDPSIRMIRIRNFHKMLLITIHSDISINGIR